MAAARGTFAALNDWLNRQVHIMEHPVGSNCQIYSHSLGRPCEYWCQDFAAAGAVANGINVFGGEKTAYTPNAAAAYQKAKRYGRTPRLGAQAFFYHASIGRIGHTGWVVWVAPDGKSFISIEGNSNDDGSRNGIGVFRVHRKVDSTVTFGYPLYKTVAPAKATAAPAKPKPKPTLREGNHGQDVLELQHDLAKLGFYKGKYDGDFGPLTKKAVIAFQKKVWPNNSKAWDGVVGTNTWTELDKRT